MIEKRARGQSELLPSTRRYPIGAQVIAQISVQISVMMLIVAAGTTGFLASARVHAAEQDGVTMPDQVQLEDGPVKQTLVLNGLGTRRATFLHVKVYVGGLYVQAKSHDPAVIIAAPGFKQIDMQFVHTASVDQLNDAWQESFELNCQTGCDALKPQLAQLKSYMSEIKSGDSMSFQFLPGRTEVFVKGKKMGPIAGDEFSKVLLSFWIGPKVKDHGLREGLLGLKPS